MAMVDIFRQIVYTRRSTFRFEINRLLPTHILRDLLLTTLRAPSSFNLQPTQIIVVQDPSIKELLARDAMIGIGNQYKTRDCSALILFLSDLEAHKRIQRIQQLERQWGKRNPTYLATMPLSASFLLGEGHVSTWLKQCSTNLISTSITRRSTQQQQDNQGAGHDDDNGRRPRRHGHHPMPQIDPILAWSYKNTALVVQTFVLAATSYNLATSIMEGYDPRYVKEILHIPDRYSIPMMVATGYEYQPPPAAISTINEDDKNKPEKHLTPRLNLNEVVFIDAFGIPINDNNNDNIHENHNKRINSHNDNNNADHVA